MVTDWYDTKEGIEGSLGSIEKFIDLLKARRAARSEENRLGDFVVLGRWNLDAYAQLGRITNEFVPADEIDDFPNVITNSELQKFIEAHDKAKNLDVLTEEEIKHPFFSYKDNTRPFPTTISFGFPSHFPYDAKCDVCGNAWTIENCHDTMVEGDGYCHEKCYHIRHAARTEHLIRSSMDIAGFKDVFMTPIKNQYSDHKYYSPWFKVETIYGDIVIGERKRVIEINYDELLPFNSKYTPDFSKENVTQGEGYIHAWGLSKAVEYLSTLHVSCVRKNWA